jgi:hypothetical protein
MRSILIDRGSDPVVVGTAINARLEDVRIAAALLLGASSAAEAELAAQAWLPAVLAAAGPMAERAHWLTVEWLPKYAPELNDIEIVWGDLKARHLAHRTFTDLDTLDAAIHDAVAALNAERNRNPLDRQRISA